MWLPAPGIKGLKNGSGLTASFRQRLNFVEGSGVTISVADDAVNEEIDVEIAASGGGSGALTLIEEISLASDGTITFDSIPGTFKDLRIEAILRGDRTGGTADPVDARVGATSVDSGANYNYDLGSVTTGNTQWRCGLIASDDHAAASGGLFICDLPSYADTTWYRTFTATTAYLQTSGSTSVVTRNAWGIWENTSDAIDIIELFPGVGTNFMAGSVARLYGLGS